MTLGAKSSGRFLQTPSLGVCTATLTLEFWAVAREGSLCVLRAVPGAKSATVTMSLCAWKHSYEELFSCDSHGTSSAICYVWCVTPCS